MKLTEDQLKQIEELSALFLSPREISCLIGVKHDHIIDEYFDQYSEIYQYYFRGKTNSKLELRKKVIPLAKLGSPQAQSLTEQYIKEQEQEELLDG